MNPTDHAQFTVPETEVARRVGLPLDEVRSRRGERNADWLALGRGHRVFWTEAAVVALVATVVPAPKRGGPIALLPDPNRIVVVQLMKTRVPNTRIVIGRVEGGNSFDPLVTVVVGNNRSRMFQPGMRVLARRQADGAIYSFEGNPDRPEKGRVWPRTPGRW
jgi:hypothetical protein